MVLLWSAMPAAAEKAKALSHLSREQLLAILENLPYATGIFDSEFRYTYYNPAGERMSGIPLAQALGKTPAEILPPAILDRMQPLLEEVRRTCQTVEAVLDFDFGHGTIYLQLAYVPILSEQGIFDGILGITEDVTREKLYEHRLVNQANHDALTGLANRYYLKDLVARQIADAHLLDNKFAFFFLDLDNFKNINDFYGHAFGDALLSELAKRLTSFTQIDLIARIGGDEFAIIQPDIKTSHCAEDFSSRLHKFLAQPFIINEQEITVSTSIGVAFFPEHGDNIDQLLKSSDVALYKAKTKGKGQTRIFNEELSASTDRRLSLEHELKNALGRGELSLAYQPIADLAGNRVIGAEALLRWKHPHMGQVGPDEFIPIAESGGMLPKIADFVLETALQTLRQISGGNDQFYMSVNLSPVQFQNRNLVKSLASTIKAAGAHPGMLQLEITESVFLDSALETVYILDGLHDLGVRLALDDFGTGYSSLNYLTRFPFHCLKIDKSFIQGIVNSRREYEIARAIIQMARALELDVVAEGIEAAAERDILKELGCKSYQGYILSKPVPLAEWRW